MILCGSCWDMCHLMHAVVCRTELCDDKGPNIGQELIIWSIKGHVKATLSKRVSLVVSNPGREGASTQALG
jgi:hypothetical protein